MEKRKVSTFLANEEKKRLLKSGKDIHLQKDDRLLKKHDRVFKKDDRVLKKRGHLSNPISECRKIQLVQDDYTPQTPTSQSINQRVYKMQVFLAKS